MIYSDRLIQAAEDYVGGGEWELFHDVLTSDFYHTPCLSPKTHFCSREHVAKELVKMKRHMDDVKEYNAHFQTPKVSE